MALVVFIALTMLQKILSNNAPEQLLSLGGTTSLLELSNSGPFPENMRYFKTILVGSKRGSLYLVNLDPDFSKISASQLLAEGESGAKPFPVYSMESDGSNALFCGGGDRYVSVWKGRQSTGKKDWRMTQRLGPHTGWVKDVVYANEKLFSIGCHCIETWKPDENGNWGHVSKSSIESDPKMGVTLSSDLLCLASIASGRLLSGGVDGRIHQWDTNTMGKPELSLPAHCGRVNALTADSTQKILFSVGHDGCLKSWYCSNRSIHAIDSKCIRTGVRALSVACWVDDFGESLRIVVGDNLG